jgi:hypothetical protein
LSANALAEFVKRPQAVGFKSAHSSGKYGTAAFLSSVV